MPSFIVFLQPDYTMYRVSGDGTLVRLQSYFDRDKIVQFENRVLSSIGSPPDRALSHGDQTILKAIQEATQRLKKS